MGRDLTDFLNVKATSGVSPDLTFLLDIDPRTAYERRTGRDGEEDRIEMMGLSYQEKVREGYIELSKEEDKRIRVIDATKTREQIYAEIKGQVWDLIS